MADRVIVGQRGTGEFGLWVSKPAKSVWSTDLNDFIFAPGFNLSLPYMIGYVDTLTTITHGLGYVPLCYFGSYNAGSTTTELRAIEVTSTTLTITGTSSFPTTYVILSTAVA